MAMENDRLGENLTTATVAVGNPNNHFVRRLRINGGVDSFSSLPNEILHQILSLIPTKYATRTSVLSKRWKHVWCETPCLYFHRLKSSSESIRKTLASYSPAKIMSFRLKTSVSNKIRAQRANCLIEFATSHNPEKISLDLSFTKNYSFPDFFFSNSSLMQLSLGSRSGASGCCLSPTSTVSWTSLRSLSLTCVVLSDASFAEMMSGCPMLESLTLDYIDSLERLDLSKSLCLRRLDIVFFPWGHRTMQIVAPHIYYLRLRNVRLSRRYRSRFVCVLVDVSSLTEANIDCNNEWWYETDDFEIVAMQAMLEKLQNVENLTLGFSFLQILSIAEFRGVPFPTFKVKTLTLGKRILQHVVPGLARLLQNSPGLKKITLDTIKCRKRNPEADVLVNDYLDKLNLDSDKCWILKDVVFPSAWDGKVAKPKLVASFVEFLLANTRTLETLILRLGSFNRSRLRELTRTLSDDNNVSVVIE